MYPLRKIFSWSYDTFAAFVWRCRQVWRSILNYELLVFLMSKFLFSKGYYFVFENIFLTRCLRFHSFTWPVEKIFLKLLAEPVQVFKSGFHDPILNECGFCSMCPSWEIRNAVIFTERSLWICFCIFSLLLKALESYEREYLRKSWTC